MNITRARLLIAAFLLASFSFAAGMLAAGKSPSVILNRQVPTDKNVDFDLFWKVWDIVSASYVDKSKVVPSKMVYGAIKGMVSSIGDPYTVFLTPDENKVSEEDLQGNFDGVGIQIGYRNGQLAVIAPLPNTPSEKAGVKAGDYIIEIKDEAKKVDKTTSGMSLPEAVQIIRGQKGTKVTVTILREGVEKPIVLDLVRDNIEVPSVVESSIEGENTVAHVKILRFGADTKKEWNKVIASINKKPEVNKIILDLRNNPGGYLQSAVDIAGDILPSGSLVVSEEEGNGSKQEFKTSAYPQLTKYKILVLVNKGSASASEILAGALRDQLKIKMVGENTFGKGSVQEPQTIEGGSGIHITIAKWLTPSGEWINDKGLPPDIKIEDDSETTQDEQLLKAVEVIKAQ